MRRVALVVAVLAAVHCGGKTDDPPISTYVIGTNKGDPNDPTSGRDPVEDGGTLTVSEGGGVSACGGTVAAFSTDFESGNLADHFTVNEPTAFSTVTANAIDGAHSLQIAADASAYLAHTLPDVCKVTLSFSVRLSAEVLASGVKLAQVNAQHHFFALVIDPGGSARVAQTAVSTGDYTTGDGLTFQGSSFAKFAADTPTLIKFEVDVSAKQVNVTVGGAANADPDGYVTMGGDDVAITEIDFGAGPDDTGPSPVPSGTWLLDDVSIQ